MNFPCDLLTTNRQWHYTNLNDINKLLLTEPRRGRMIPGFDWPVDGSSQVRELYMALSIGTRELPISPILHPWRWRMISPPASARTSDFIQRASPLHWFCSPQPRRHANPAVYPSLFVSVSLIRIWIQAKNVLARHAPYFLNSWIKIYTFNSRQQPTYQHSTFVSSSLPSLSDLFPFQIRKTRPQRLPPFFFLFRKAWLSTPVFCDT